MTPKLSLWGCICPEDLVGKAADEKDYSSIADFQCPLPMEEQSQKSGTGHLEGPICYLKDSMAEPYVNWVYWRGGSLWVHLNPLSCPTSLLAGLYSQLNY